MPHAHDAGVRLPEPVSLDLPKPAKTSDVPAEARLRCGGETEWRAAGAGAVEWAGAAHGLDDRVTGHAPRWDALTGGAIDGLA